MVSLQAIEGKYEVLEKIKEGGMGAVYKVRHRYLDEVRVIKVIRPSLEPTRDLQDRFLREAQVANRLRHPNIAQLYDFAVGEDGNAFIVMEFIDGLTLEDLVRLAGPPPVGLALEIGRQALRAIGYLHRRGYVHRDVAPDNLMLSRSVDGEPLVKLIDLGIAKVLEGDGSFTSTGMFLGKPRYASPEHFGAEAQVSERSDLYSFGIVLYELLTGFCPIQGHDAASYMAGHLLRPVLDFAHTDPEGRLPSDLRWVLLRTLAKKAEERIDGADELARHLTALQARYPWEARDLEQALAAAHHTTTATAAAVSPSTQSFLDRQFQAGATPAPTAQITLDTSDVPLATPQPAAGLATRPPADTRMVSPLAPAADLRTRSLPGPSALDDTVTLPGRAGLRAGWDSLPWEGGPGKGAAALPPPAPPVPRAAVRRRSWIAAALTGLFVVAALGGGIWVYKNPSQGMAGTAAMETTDIAAPAGEGAALAAPLTTEGPAPEATAQAAQATVPAAAAAKAADPPGTAGPAKAVRTPVEADGPSEGLIRPGPGVEYPEPRAIPGGVYPEAAKGSGKSPTVTVRVLVDENGAVVDARIRDGEEGFNEAALEAARKARFHPATRDGVAGRMWADIGIEFTPPPAPATQPAPSP